MKISLLIISIICFSFAHSQDYIFKKNGDEIKAKVLEIGKEEVKYKMFDNLNGPTYNISKDDVLLIKYENGTRETFAQSNTMPQANKNGVLQGDPQKIVIPSGTLVKVQLLQDISSKTAKDGDMVSFTTIDAVFSDGKLAAPVGSPVSGQVIDAEKRKGLGKPGTLNISVDYLTLPNGDKVKLKANATVKGKDKTASALTGALVLGPFSLLKKGKDAKIVKGTIYTVYVD